jgi:hypothetical protein
MSIFNGHQQDEMKIEHTTYDETHTRRRSILRRASDASETLGKVKNYFSRHLSRHSGASISLQNPSPRTERPVTQWPKPGTPFSLSEKPSEMTTYLKKQHCVEKAARKDERLIVSANNSGTYLPLKDTNNESEADDAPFPALRRKPNFTRTSKGELTIKSTDSQQQNEDGKDNMEKLHKLRQAIKDGRLEQVIPPRKPSRMEGQLAPPQSRFVDHPPRVSGDSSRDHSLSQHHSSSRQRDSSRSRKTKSSSSKFVDYLRISADILDEKRRDVQSKFQAPFEHLNYPSFSLSRKVSVTSSNSTESFWCVGENTEEQKATTQARQQESRRVGRLNGVGLTPWTSHVPDDCNFCGKFGMIGPKGLCETCESEYDRRRAPGLEHTNRYPDPEWEDEVRPTPPLKDRKPLSMRRGRDLQRLFHVDTNNLDNERAPVPLKDMGSRPIFNAAPSRKFSQEAQIEDGDEEKYLNWKTSSQREEFEKTQSTFKRWSLSLENDDLEKGQEEDKMPLIEGKGKVRAKKNSSRDTNFYRFYDDVLEDH